MKKNTFRKSKIMAGILAATLGLSMPALATSHGNGNGGGNPGGGGNGNGGGNGAQGGMANVLHRVDMGDPTLNTMEVDINMGGFDLNNTLNVLIGKFRDNKIAFKITRQGLNSCP